MSEDQGRVLSALGYSASPEPASGLGPTGEYPSRGPLEAALTYFRPHPATHGPVMLTPDRMREHLAVIEEAIDAWKRVAVIAAIPLEAMRAAGTYRALSASTQACVDEAVITIRMAICGHSLPPEGEFDVGVAPARAILAAASGIEAEGRDAQHLGAKPESPTPAEVTP